MDLSGDTNRHRLVGDYIIGPKIGSGSFAEVWRSRHRHLGTEFAIKEIDKKHLNDNLLKEISILRNITHPNIIRLFEAIETEDRIFLVLEYCEGGDLAAYINRHGRVSEEVARHFMRQLAAGLQVLRENHLIHRDLKPQNLLLSSKDVTPLLKIGDFGFARYLTPQGLADTLCGSPLYMAPEIIQNQKYDAKADLWSVGAILFQLIMGKPPFDGKSQLELFQNILTSSELRFPEGALKALHPDYVELCRSLLRRNPVERLTFEEFFNHKFLVEPRVTKNVEQSSSASQMRSSCRRAECHIYENMPLLHPETRLSLTDKNAKLNDESRVLCGKDQYDTSSIRDVHGFIPYTSTDKISQSLSSSPGSSSQPRDLMESIERSYVLVNSHYSSTETVISSIEASPQESSTARTSVLLPQIDGHMPVAAQPREPPAASVGGMHNSSSSGLGSAALTAPPEMFSEVHGPYVLLPSRRLQFLHQYLCAISDIAKEQINAGLFLASFSVELVILAIWKEAIRICSSWLASSGGSDVCETSIGNETPDQDCAGSSTDIEDTLDFAKPSLASLWAKRGFIAAYDTAERLSKHLQCNAEMPDAMDIIFRTALDAGRSGAVDAWMEKHEEAAASYSKAKLLLSFILAEAPSLPLNPPILLSLADKQRLQKYIRNLEYHKNCSRMAQSSLGQSSGTVSVTKYI
ncbi:hypothetical protein Ancab_038132 [Ancistrocladus abbreviatus]